VGHAVVEIFQWSNFGRAESQIRQLVWEPEYEPDILLDLNAMSIKKSWTIAPLTNSNYGGFDKQRWATYRLKTQDSPVLGNHSVQLNRTSNPLLHRVLRVAVTSAANMFRTSSEYSGRGSFLGF
jgi:hypothetical protein